MKTQSFRIPLPLLRRLRSWAPQFNTTIQGLASACISEGLDRRAGEWLAAKRAKGETLQSLSKFLKKKPRRKK